MPACRISAPGPCGPLPNHSGCKATEIPPPPAPAMPEQGVTPEAAGQAQQQGCGKAGIIDKSVRAALLACQPTTASWVSWVVGCLGCMQPVKRAAEGFGSVSACSRLVGHAASSEGGGQASACWEVGGLVAREGRCPFAGCACAAGGSGQVRDGAARPRGGQALPACCRRSRRHEQGRPPEGARRLPGVAQWPSRPKHRPGLRHWAHGALQAGHAGCWGGQHRNIHGLPIWGSSGQPGMWSQPARRKCERAGLCQLEVGSTAD
jgi:hypothetical protein